MRMRIVLLYVPLGRTYTTAMFTVISELVNPLTFPLLAPALCDNSNRTAVEEGEVATLTCSMNHSGLAAVWEVTWQRGNTRLSSINQDQQFTLERVLVFPVYSGDGGMYSCLVEALGFRTECQTWIEVVGE